YPVPLIRSPEMHHARGGEIQILSTSVWRRLTTGATIRLGCAPDCSAGRPSAAPQISSLTFSSSPHPVCLPSFRFPLSHRADYKKLHTLPPPPVYPPLDQLAVWSIE